MRPPPPPPSSDSLSLWGRGVEPDRLLSPTNNNRMSGRKDRWTDRTLPNIAPDITHNDIVIHPSSLSLV